MQPSQIATTQPATVIAKVQQPPRPASTSAQPASFLVVDDQQPGTSRQLMFTLSLAKTVKPPSVASGQQEDSQHFWIVKPLWRDSKCTTVPADRHNTTIFTLSTLTSTVTSAIFYSSRTVKTSQPVQPAELAQISRSACIKSHQLALIRATRIFQKQLLKLLFIALILTDWCYMAARAGPPNARKRRPGYTPVRPVPPSPLTRGLMLPVLARWP